MRYCNIYITFFYSYNTLNCIIGRNNCEKKMKINDNSNYMIFFREWKRAHYALHSVEYRDRDRINTSVILK